VLVVIGLGGVRLSGAVRRREKGIVVKGSATRAEKREEKRAAKDAEVQAEKDAARRRELEREAAREPARVTAGFPVYHAEPVVEPVIPVTRPVSPASPVSPGAAAPLHPVVDEASLTESERAARAAAASRDETRNATADASGAPRPPLHG
jgi:hypothetical protein